MKTGTMSSEK